LGVEGVGIFGKFLVKGWGVPIFWPGREKKWFKMIYKIGSFDPFLDWYGVKTLKNCSNNPFGPLLIGTLYLFIYLFLPFFGHFLWTSDETVGEGPLFFGNKGPFLNSDLLQTMSKMRLAMEN
jgi:hypothetical protein